MVGKGDEEEGGELERREEGNFVVATSSPYYRFSLGIGCALLIHCWYELILLFWHLCLFYNTTKLLGNLPRTKKSPCVKQRYLRNLCIISPKVWVALTACELCQDAGLGSTWP